ncbi:hypothetical protein GCM10009718_35730 [Isoptericola halotolerans]|uniref:WXG100 family type VII secretion target n=1 Tax=Isoptericola halotolerans TaxID=300560 RepID=A0ABX2A5L7_9MICO|nr:hypothetical protein [Isoptericola halotolerans]NOV97218.1 hypothetical protein [Isoptericola halotolerans]
MGEMYGADVEQLRALSQRLSESSAELESAAGLISQLVETVPWYGPSAEMFRDEWAWSYEPSLRSAAHGLTDASQKAARNADDQEATSNSYDGSGVGSEPGGPGTGTGGTGPGADGGGADGGDSTGPDLFPDWLTDVQNGATWTGLAADLGEGALRANVDDWAQLGGYGRGLSGLATGLAGLGAGLGAYQTITGIADGNGWQVADGLVNTGLGVAGLLVTAATPAGWVVLGAGAVWAGSSLLASHLGYDHTSEMFVDAGRWVGNTVADGAGAVWDGVENAAGAVADAGAALADGASSVVSSIKGWF